MVVLFSSRWNKTTMLSWMKPITSCSLFSTISKSQWFCQCMILFQNLSCSSRRAEKSLPSISGSAISCLTIFFRCSDCHIDDRWKKFMILVRSCEFDLCAEGGKVFTYHSSCRDSWRKQMNYWIQCDISVKCHFSCCCRHSHSRRYFMSKTKHWRWRHDDDLENRMAVVKSACW